MAAIKAARELEALQALNIPHTVSAIIESDPAGQPLQTI